MEWLGHLDWFAMVALATVTTYLSVTIQSPAYTDGPTDDTWLKGISFFTVFCVRAVITMLILLPVLLVMLWVWPAFRRDFMYRCGGESRNAIIYAILLTMVGNNRVSRDVAANVRELMGEKVFKTQISTRAILAETGMKGPIQAYSPNSDSAQEYNNLAQEVVNFVSKQ